MPKKNVRTRTVNFVSRCHFFDLHDGTIILNTAPLQVLGGQFGDPDFEHSEKNGQSGNNPE
jgi:hypothetical protein